MPPVVVTPLALSFLLIPPTPKHVNYFLTRRPFRNVSSRRTPTTVNMAVRRNIRSRKAKPASTESSAVDNSTSITDGDRKKGVDAGHEYFNENENKAIHREDSTSTASTDNFWLFDEDDEDGRIESQLAEKKNSGYISNGMDPLEEEDDDDNDELPIIEDLDRMGEGTDTTEELENTEEFKAEEYVSEADDAGSNVSNLSSNIDDIATLGDEDDEDPTTFDDTGNFDSGVQPFISKSYQRKLSPMSGQRAVFDPDENDDAEEMDDLFDPAAAEIEYDDSLDVVDANDADVADEDSTDDFDPDSEEDIQSAADILSNRGLLGLGVEKETPDDEDSLGDFALQADLESEVEKDLEVPEVPDDTDAELGLSGVMDDEDRDEEDAAEDEDDSLDVSEEESELEDYPDLDEGDNELGLTSPSNIGRIWELNEDSYVTITEPGQSYGYEMDEDDQEDQDMATMRRGKQGGWSGGLASYPASDLPKGSREWIARRSYELMMKSSYIDMIRWAKRHGDPPPEITALYPDDPPPSMPLGTSVMKMSAPPAAVTLMGQSDDPDEDYMGVSDEMEIDDEPHALDRSIKFPCNYKFKVEGDVDDGFIPSIRKTVENVLGKRFPRSGLSSEPAGRYQRVTITVEVQSARQVTELYDALRTNPLVKFSYG